VLFRNLDQALYIIPALLIALTFHEYAHGKMAAILGDPTARQQGRLTLNPIHHIDPVGLLMLALAGFGWAKPVPVNPMFFRGDRRRGMVLVALAGPGTNFVMALIAAILRNVLLILALNGTIFLFDALDEFFNFLVIFNVFLGVFNLLPVPPLDGSKILFNLLPPKYSRFMYALERYGFLILILLLVTRLHEYFLLPAAGFVLNLVYRVAGVLVTPFF